MSSSQTSPSTTSSNTCPTNMYQCGSGTCPVNARNCPTGTCPNTTRTYSGTCPYMNGTYDWSALLPLASRLFTDGSNLFNTAGFMANDIAPMFEDLGNALVRWTPIGDVYLTDSTYEVSMELPGCNKSDIECTISGRTMTIRGEKRNSRTENVPTGTVNERYYGSFTRSFTLPSNVDTTNVATSFVNGVLTVSMPRTTPAVNRVVIN